MFKISNFCNLIKVIPYIISYIFQRVVVAQSGKFHLADEKKLHTAFSLPFCYEYFSLARVYHIFIYQNITIFLLFYCNMYNSVNNIILYSPDLYKYQTSSAGVVTFYRPRFFTKKLCCNFITLVFYAIRVSISLIIIFNNISLRFHIIIPLRNLLYTELHRLYISTSIHNIYKIYNLIIDHSLYNIIMDKLL